MKARAVTRRIFGAFVAIGLAVAVPTAVFADDAKDIQKHDRQLFERSSQLDRDAARASSTPEGQQRLSDRLAKQFKVDASVVSGLRARGLSYGQSTIALALSQELMKQDKTLTQQAALDKLLAERQAHKGWGVIAQEYGLKLGHVISEVKRADKAAHHIAGKPQDHGKPDNVVKAEKADKPEKIEKVEKPEKPEKPAKPEKPGR